ncbi:MAG: hypothetical protein BRC26_04390 [Nanohaloarchaea archaeon QH_8_44_6]|nr:MAG: hypothetical protein BRC26_04390 [Nanohaloarchaea archaeon QH_8_44_6]
MRGRDRLERFTEFLIFGIILGVTEDMIAVMLVTDESFTLRMLGIVIAVTIPFAAFSELVVDSDEYKITERISGRIRDLL